MYLHGSIGRGETDAYSDIDVCAVIEDDHYEAVRGEMRSICEDLFGPIVIWLPEGEQPRYCNFAFLFEHGDELLLTDFDIVARSLFVEWNRPPDRILWDRHGILARVSQAAASAPTYTDERLLRLIDTYWVYAYLDGKYMRRDDVYKMLYVQQTLLQLHIRLLHARHMGEEGAWWAGDIVRLPEATQAELRCYFSGPSVSRAARALARSIGLFARDAQRFCAERGIRYPEEREQAVRRHLAAMGLPVDTSHCLS